MVLDDRFARCLVLLPALLLWNCQAKRAVLYVSLEDLPEETRRVRVTRSWNGAVVTHGMDQQPDPEEFVQNLTQFSQTFSMDARGVFGLTVEALDAVGCTLATANQDIELTGVAQIERRLPLQRRKIQVTLARLGDGVGTVESAPAGLSCSGPCVQNFPSCGRLSLRETSAGGSHFLGWSGPCAGTANCDFTASGDVTVRANLVKVPAKQCSSGGWCWENPRPNGTYVSDLWGNSAQDIWAVGNLLQHYDGQTWAPVSEQGGSHIWGRSATEVWVTKGGGEIKRWDGVQWATALLRPDTEFNGLSGSGVNDLWVAANNGILRFDGQTWTDLQAPTKRTYNGIWASSASDVWAVGLDSNNAGVAVHFDGQRWSDLPPMPSGIDAKPYSVWGGSPQDIWVGGNVLDGSILRYDGVAWKQYAGRDGQMKLWGISGKDVWAICTNGGISAMHFNGATWSPFDLGSDTPYVRTLWGSASDNLWFGGDGLLTQWTGERFTSASQRITRADLNRVWSSGGGAIAVGAQGTILRFNGLEWVRQDSSTMQNLNGLWAKSWSDIWAVGENGTIVHYDGTRWSTVPSPSTEPLVAIFGPWIVTRFKNILHRTSDTWEYVNSLPSGGVMLKDIWGSDPDKDVWVVGPGALWHWNGSTWTSLLNDPDLQLNVVWGSGPKDVWAAGNKLLHYDGSNWTQRTAPFRYLTALWGKSATDIWAAGSNGMTFHFDGSIWTNFSAQGSLPSAISGNENGTLWLVGANGAIMRRN